MLFWVSYMPVFCIVVFELVQCNSACFKQKGTLEIRSLLVLSLLCWGELIRFQPSRTTAKKASLTSGGTCADPCQVQGSSTGRLPGQSRRTDQRSGDGSWKKKKQSCMASGGENPSCVLPSSEMKICGSERDRNQWPSRYSRGSGTGSDTPSGSQHPAPHACPDLEPTGEEKERPASQQLEVRHWSRAEIARDQLVQNDKSSPEQCDVEGRWWPMLHRERWA